MAPIHPLEAPEGLEHLLGSVYDFFRHYRRHERPDFAIEPVMLNRSFRSNREIVAFVREAGYGEDLEAAGRNAGLRIATVAPIPVAEPADWPEQLPWSPNLAAILSPDEPLAAVVHNDRFSSQRNDEEADLAASLVLALYRAGLHDLEGADSQLYSPDDFFRRGIGIVTPHRAQQAAVFDRLAAVLPTEVDRNAVFASIDTARHSMPGWSAGTTPWASVISPSAVPPSRAPNSTCVPFSTSATKRSCGNALSPRLAPG